MNKRIEAVQRSFRSRGEDEAVIPYCSRRNKAVILLLKKGELVEDCQKLLRYAQSVSFLRRSDPS